MQRAPRGIGQEGVRHVGDGLDTPRTTTLTSDAALNLFDLLRRWVDDNRLSPSKQDRASRSLWNPSTLWNGSWVMQLSVENEKSPQVAT